jgi:hypothetical protein
MFVCFLSICVYVLSVTLFSDFLAGNVPQHYRTKKLPEDWNKTPVKVGFCLFVCLSVWLFICLFACFSFCLSGGLSFWPVMFRNIISPKSCRKIGTRLSLRFV